MARATAWIVLAPYSRICVPETLIALNRGISLLQYSTRSPTSLIDGSGGKIQVPRAMYSLRMSFWIVPRSFLVSTPCFWATRTYMARMIGAVALIVKDVEIPSREMPVVDPLEVIEGVHGDAELSHIVFRQRHVGIEADLGRQIEGQAQARLTVLQQVLEALVGALRRRLAGVLAHRPHGAAVHRRIDAAGEGKFTGIVELLFVVEIRQIVRSVKHLDRRAQNRRNGPHLCSLFSPWSFSSFLLVIPCAVAPVRSTRRWCSSGSGRRQAPILGLARILAEQLDPLGLEFAQRCLDILDAQADVVDPLAALLDELRGGARRIHRLDQFEGSTPPGGRRRSWF